MPSSFGLWNRASSVGGRKKREIKLFFFRARRFRFFRALFSSPFRATFSICAHERESAKKAPAPSSDLKIMSERYKNGFTTL
jgi:hypothetical protein